MFLTRDYSRFTAVATDPIFEMAKSIENVKKLPLKVAQGVGEGLLFVYRFVRSPTNVGALFLCSSYVAEKVCKHIPASDPAIPRRYLEVGPGTGVFTDVIAPKLGPNDRLDLVEFDPDFCELLRKKYENNPNVFVHQMSIEDWKPAYKYDAIVSALPMNSFRADFVNRVFRQYRDFSKNQTRIAYIEYMGLPDLKKPFLNETERMNFDKVLSHKEQFFEAYGSETDKVWLNMPPVRVFHCQVV